MNGILLVDDKEENLHFLRTLLEGHGYAVETARHGAEALVKARRLPPQLVISDLLMPVMDGYALLRHWKADERLKASPFVVYTATYTEPEDEHLALALGADAFILKPTEPEPFMARIAEVLALPTPSIRTPMGDEHDLLHEYDTVVVRKLEAKAFQLEEANRELAAGEARLRAILDTEPECVKLLAADGTLLEMNPAGLRMAEADSFSQVANQCIYALVAEAHRAAFRALTEQVFRGESGTLEYEIVGLKGTHRWLDTHASPLRDQAGTVIAALGITRDITERRRADEVRYKLEAQLRQAQKMEALGTLAGGIAHDFNNIVGAIIGNVALARQDLGADHPAQVSLAEIDRASRRARELIQQILTFSRQQPQERRVVRLQDVAAEAVNLLRATLPAGIELVATLATDTPNVLADRTQIHQVLMNLCTNAWHAIATATGRIEVALAGVTVGDDTSRMKPGRYACLSVTDTGRGMDKDTVERIFDPFFTTKALGEGTGLGLAVVDGIVKSHGGWIAVHSVPGQGTAFQVFIPAAAGEAEVSRVAPPQLSRGEGQRILYLDDEEALVTLATRLLGRLGFKVQAYTRAAEALAAFRADPAAFDVVIADLNMPGASGLEVATEMLRVRPDLPVALASGYVTETLRQQAGTLGVREVIYKATTVEELVAAIHRLLNRFELRDNG